VTASVIRIARSEGYEISPRGVRSFYPAGDYKVPGDMPPEIARRCLESGIGQEVQTKADKPENKLQKKANSTKKKKH